MSYQPKKGSVVFYDSCPPPLKAGEYELQVNQTVEEPIPLEDGSIDHLSIDEESSRKLPGTQAAPFAITGPRFILQPDEIHSVYPPANADGPFEARLPCVVLKRRTLPWERTSSEDQKSKQPWLALLLFSEDEVTLLDPPNCNAESVLSHKPFSWAPESSKTGAKKLYDSLTEEEKKKACLGIEIKHSLLQEVAPLASELPLLTHVRQVNTEDKELLGQDKDGWFSVVVGNRLPVSGKKYVACLVSLEGQEDMLPDSHEALDTPRNPSPLSRVSTEMAHRTQVHEAIYGNPYSTERTEYTIDHEELYASADTATPHRMESMPSAVTENAMVHSISTPVTHVSSTEEAHVANSPIAAASWFTYNPDFNSFPYPEPTVKLICLARWTFQCEGKGDFEGLMKALPESGGIGLMGMTAHQSTNSATTPNSKYRVALDSGHIPLNHQARDGDQKTSFYRGPMVPVGVERNTNEGPYHTSDQARRIDPLTGFENVGYASAFELGRLMALNDSKFALELLKWRRAGHQQASKLITGLNIKEKLGLLIPNFDPRQFLDHKMLIEQLLDRVGPRILDEALLGTLTDPTGLADITDKLPGLDGHAVMEALNLESGQVESMLGMDLQSGQATGGLAGNGNLVDELELTVDSVLTGGFDEVLKNTELELGHLDAEHSAVFDELDAADFEGPGGL